LNNSCGPEFGVLGNNTEFQWIKSIRSEDHNLILKWINRRLHESSELSWFNAIDALYCMNKVVFKTRFELGVKARVDRRAIQMMDHEHTLCKLAAIIIMHKLDLIHNDMNDRVNACLLEIIKTREDNDRYDYDLVTALFYFRVIPCSNVDVLKKILDELFSFCDEMNGDTKSRRSVIQYIFEYFSSLPANVIIQFSTKFLKLVDYSWWNEIERVEITLWLNKYVACV
jgi:hypothetical protein